MAPRWEKRVKIDPNRPLPVTEGHDPLRASHPPGVAGKDALEKDDENYILVFVGQGCRLYDVPKALKKGIEIFDTSGRLRVIGGEFKKVSFIPSTLLQIS